MKSRNFFYSLASIVLTSFLVSVFIVFAADPGAPFAPDDNVQDPGDPGTGWGGCGPTDPNCYVTVSSEISGLDPASATNTIDNGDYLQEWQWNTLAGGTGLKLSTTSILDSNGQKLLEVSRNGTNNELIDGDPTPTYAGYFSNTENGVGGNYGIYAEASGGTDTIAVYGTASIIGMAGRGTGGINSIGTAGYNTSGKGVWGYSSGGDSGYAVYAQNINTTGTGYGLYSTVTGAKTAGFAGYFSATGATSNVGLYATASGGTTNYAIESDGILLLDALPIQNIGTRSISIGAGIPAVTDSFFFGTNAGLTATGANNSVFIGPEAGELATNAFNSNFIGFQAGETASAADYSVFIGDQAGEDATNANEAVYIGRNAGQSATNAQNSVFLGEDAGQGAVNASESIFLGTTAGDGDTVSNDNTKYSILIGPATSTGGFSSSIAMGRGATNTASNQLVIGSSTGVGINSISSIFFGSGVTAATPIDYTINGSGALGTDIGGGDVTIASGRATGNATGGSILFQTSDAGASGATLRNLSTKMTILASGFVGISNTAPGVALHVGSASTTDGTTLLRLEDANSTCNFTADAGAPTCGSDRRLKTDIEELNTNDILENITSLNPVSYRWKTDDEDAPLQYGFIAQNVQDYFPNLVKQGEWIDGSQKLFLSMGGLIPYTVGAIKELDIKLNDIQNFEDEDSVFGDKLVTWFASSTNGIKKLFVKDEICIGETCINEEQLKEILAGQKNVSGNNNENNQEDTDTDEVMEEDLVIEEGEEDGTIEESAPEEIIPAEEEELNEPEEIINQENEQTNEENHQNDQSSN